MSLRQSFKKEETWVRFKEVRGNFVSWERKKWNGDTSPAPIPSLNNQRSDPREDRIKSPLIKSSLRNHSCFCHVKGAWHSTDHGPTEAGVVWSWAHLLGCNAQAGGGPWPPTASVCICVVAGSGTRPGGHPLTAAANWGRMELMGWNSRGLAMFPHHLPAGLPAALTSPPRQSWILWLN